MKSYFLYCLFVVALVYAEKYSVLYDAHNGKFTVTSSNLRSSVATLWYEDKINEDGWGHIKVVTDGAYPDELQAEAAGFIEGYVEYERIAQHISNIRAINFKGSPVPEGIENYLREQIAFIRKMVSNPPRGEERYWRYVGLMMKQVEGLTNGFNAHCEEKDRVSFQEMYMHNADGDMETLLDMFSPGDRRWDMLECSALVRMMGDGEIYMGHATWRNYAAMLRHYKFYELHYHDETVRLSFSASPGFVNSKDDFYVNGFGIGAMETTNAIYDETLYKHCTTDTVPSFIRSQVSNMLSHDPKTWVDTFEMYNSGTYNNQWMAVDLNGAGKSKDIMWIVEQIPGLTIKEDVTPYLYRDGYWASYNIPYIREIYEKSGYPSQPQTPDIDYYNCSRHNIFQRDAPRVSDLKGFLAILRSNDYKNDPLAEGNPRHVIASR